MARGINHSDREVPASLQLPGRATTSCLGAILDLQPAYKWWKPELIYGGSSDIWPGENNLAGEPLRASLGRWILNCPGDTQIANRVGVCALHVCPAQTF